MGIRLSLYCTDNQPLSNPTPDSPPITPELSCYTDDENKDVPEHQVDLLAYYAYEMNNVD